MSLPLRLQSLLLLLGLLAGWELVCWFFAISPLFLPAPSAIALRLIDLVGSGLIWSHLLTTLTSVLAGLALGAVSGLAVGAVIALLPSLERLVYPYLVALQTVPKIAIAPLFIMWFGYGVASKIVIAALICFFPVLVAVVAGFHNVERDRLDMLRAYGATPWQILWHLRVPGALVMIFAGLEIAAVMAVIGAIVGEFVGAQAGLGYLITVLNFNLDVAGVFAVLLFLSAIGLVINTAVRVAGRRLVFWQSREAVRVLS